MKLLGNIEDSSFQFSFGLCQWTMQFLGIWPIDDYSFGNFKYYFTLSTCAFGLFSSTVSIFSASTRTDAFKRVMYLVIAIFTTLKIIILKRRKKELKYLLEGVALNWNRYSMATLEAKKIITSYMNQGRVANIILSTFTQIGVLCKYIIIKYPSLF